MGLIDKVQGRASPKDMLSTVLRGLSRTLWPSVDASMLGRRGNKLNACERHTTAYHAVSALIPVLPH